MSAIPAVLRRLVEHRARGRCEHCQLSQEGQEATFHIDHVFPIKAGGQTVIENLALACVSCSLQKAVRQRAIDPLSGEEVRLYNPRRDNWDDHFQWQGNTLVGLTPHGRATIVALTMNRLIIRAIRAEETALGRHPPQRSNYMQNTPRSGFLGATGSLLPVPTGLHCWTSQQWHPNSRFDCQIHILVCLPYR